MTQVDRLRGLEGRGAALLIKTVWIFVWNMCQLLFQFWCYKSEGWLCTDMADPELMKRLTSLEDALQDPRSVIHVEGLLVRLSYSYRYALHSKSSLFITEVFELESFLWTCLFWGVRTASSRLSLLEDPLLSIAQPSLDRINSFKFPCKQIKLTE